MDSPYKDKPDMCVCVCLLEYICFLKISHSLVEYRSIVKRNHLVNEVARIQHWNPNEPLNDELRLKEVLTFLVKTLHRNSETNRKWISYRRNPVSIHLQINWAMKYCITTKHMYTCISWYGNARGRRATPTERALWSLQMEGNFHCICIASDDLPCDISHAQLHNNSHLRL